MIKIQQIYNNFLYTSNYYKYSCNKLKTKNISAIIIVGNDFKNEFHNTYYLDLKEQDLWNKTKLLENIIRVNDIIDKEIKNGSVIIQCKDGKSMCIIFIITYIIHKFNGDPCSIYNYIKRHNPDIVSTYLPMLIDIYDNFQNKELQNQYQKEQEYKSYQMQQYEYQKEQENKSYQMQQYEYKELLEKIWRNLLS
jgi:hypothetical protein